MTDTEKLTWQEIRSRYPDEWVILVDVDADHVTDEVRGGVVFDHGKNHRELLVKTKAPLAGKDSAILYTGEVGKGNYLF